MLLLVAALVRKAFVVERRRFENKVVRLPLRLEAHFVVVEQSKIGTTVEKGKVQQDPQFRHAMANGGCQLGL